MAGQTNFPSTFDSHTSGSPVGFAVQTDDAQTSLNAALSSGATTVSVVDTTDFPSVGSAWVDSDEFTWTGKNSTGFTGVSGVDSPHVSGAVVAQVPSARNHNDLAAAAVALEKFVGYGLGYKNRIRNGNMRLKARGTLSTVDNTYTLDGWRFVHEGGAIVTQTTSDPPSATSVGGSNAALKIQFDGSSGRKAGVFQPIEAADSKDLRGQIVSLQMKLKVSSTAVSDVRASIVQWTGSSEDDTALASDPINAWGGGATNPTYTGSWTTGNTPANLSPSTNWALHKLEAVATLSTALQNIGLLIWSDDTSNATTDFFQVSDVQLERGEYCTPFERVPRAIETDRNRWYYEELGGENAFQTFGPSAAQSATSFVTTVFYQHPKRITPTIGFSATASDYAIIDSSGGLVALTTGPTAVRVVRNLASITGVTAAGLSTGHAGIFIANNNVNVRITVSAEL